MNCGECTEDQGEPVAIEYTDGTTETLALCASCREEFAEGALVSDIDRVEVEVEVEESRTNG